MGLAPEALLARNPKLVVLRISGWGQDGPYRRRPGFGTLIEGMSGFAAMNGFADREPVLPPMYLADSVAGLCGAKRGDDRLARGGDERRQRTGDRPAAARAVFTIMGPQAAVAASYGQGEAAHRQPLDHTSRRATPTAPGTGIGSVCPPSIQKLAERCSADRAPELIEDPRCATNAGRVLAPPRSWTPSSGPHRRAHASGNVAYFEREK